MPSRIDSKPIKPGYVPPEVDLAQFAKKQGTNGLTYQQLMDEFVQKKMATKLSNVVGLSNSEFKEFQKDITELKQKLPLLMRSQSTDTKKVNESVVSTSQRNDFERFLKNAETITRSPFVVMARSVTHFIGKFVDNKSSWLQGLKNSVSNLFTRSAKDDFYSAVKNDETKTASTQSAPKGTYAESLTKIFANGGSIEKATNAREEKEIKAQAQTTAKSGVTVKAKAQITPIVENAPRSESPRPR